MKRPKNDGIGGGGSNCEQEEGFIRPVEYGGCDGWCNFGDEGRRRLPVSTVKEVV